MKAALFDCFSGASGDMILGALVDAGLPFAQLKKCLAKLGLKGVSLRAARQSRKGIAGTRVHVDIHARTNKSRNIAQIIKIIRSGSLPAAVQENACAIFSNIARVEAKIHRVPVSKVHFHEIGALDSIVDIVGACFGIHFLGLKKIFFTPLPLGGGWAQTQHGRYPIPAPATAMLLRGIPVRWGVPCEGEWTTPTGAAILTHFGTCVTDAPAMACEAIGYGVGTADPHSHPNLLRLVIGTPTETAASGNVWSLQTNIDDMQPQWYGPVLEKLFKAGALDAFMIPVQMKKNRPATILEVLCEDAHVERISRILLSETTTFGIRMSKVQRRVLDRQIRLVKTPLGKVRFKLGWLDGVFLKAVAEFEDCLALAHRKKLPLGEVYRVLAQYTPQA